MKTVTVVGLGYVGLPVACRCLEKGHEVYGLDTDTAKIDLLKQGKSPIDDAYINEKIKKYSGKLNVTNSPNECIPGSDVVIVCVPTPVNEDHLPDLQPLITATESIAPHLKETSLLSIESTIYPGTVEELITPVLMKAGRDPRKNIKVVHCPERIDPGNKEWTLEKLPRVIGGMSEEATKSAKTFYESIIDAPITVLSSVKAAEATKIMENTFRDINIAFVNEMAMSFDKEGIDIIEVIRGAATKPFAFMPHYPGAGVGGHCIPVDPYYLIEKAKQIGFGHRFLKLAREINNNMPAYTVSLLENELEKQNKKLASTKIGILGVAYKADVDDIRESPALEIMKHLNEKKAHLEIFDPFVPSKSTVSSLRELLQKVDCIILAADHAVFKKINASELKDNSIVVVIDGRNCLDKESIQAAGISYHGIGRS